MPGKILIVDDIATNRVILRVKLSAARYSVLEAECGETALEMARAERPSLILMDVSMPRMSGLEVCRLLKQSDETARIPVVLFSAYPSASTKLKALAAGAEEFMAKPLDELALMARIRSLLRARHITEELSLRDGTSRALGLGLAEDAAPAIVAPGRITLMAEDRRMALGWRNALASRLHDTLIVHNPQTVLPEGDRTDVFVISSGTRAEGLQMIPELRARSDVRNAAIIAVLPEDCRTDAAMALDLGATDIIIGTVDGEELALRLSTHLRRKREADQLRKKVADGLQLAVTDPLTGLFNRRYALSHLHRARTKAQADGRSFALMMIDLDRFKAVNDTHGHAAGDHVLKTVARRLEANLRSVDLLARIGGEEFLAVLPDCDAAAATSAAERLRATVGSTPIALPKVGDIDGSTILQTISIGVVVVGAATDSTTPRLLCSNEADLLEQADRALYRSKATGRNSVTLGEAAA